MGARSSKLADQFEAAVADLEQAINNCPDDKWNAVSGDEGWTVAQLAEHVAGQFPLEMEYITAIAEGRDLPSYSWDDINGKNDSRATGASNVSKESVQAQLKEGAASTAAYLRALDDSQLDNKKPLPLANGAEVTTEQVIMGGILIDHVNGHLKSIRGT